VCSFELTSKIAATPGLVPGVAGVLVSEKYFELSLYSLFL